MELTIDIDRAREIMFEQLCDEHGLDADTLEATLERDAERVVVAKLTQLYENPDDIELENG